MNLTTLPSLCLVSILSKLPLNDLLLVASQVTSRWRTLLVTGTSVTHHVKHLTIQVDDSGVFVSNQACYRSRFAFAHLDLVKYDKVR